MTPEERMDKIDERLQAVAETLEIVAGMQKTNEESIAVLSRNMIRLVDIVQAHEQRLNEGSL